MTSLPITGERTIPGVASENYWFQRHVAAYRFAAANSGGSTVDAGCGEGYGAAILARDGRPVLGLDIDLPAVRHAKHRYRIARFACADLRRLPLPEASVQSIIALQVIEHLDDVDAFLSGCVSSLRPGGSLIVSTPNRLTFPASRNPFHVHELEPTELLALLASFFARVDLVGLHHGGWLRTLDRVIGEPVQHRLVRTPYAELAAPVRAALRAVRPGSFRVTSDVERALDLLAVCRSIEEP